jgi:3-oxoadipate enol-lactonase
MTYAHVGELSVWYERRGSGRPVLFISGTGGDLRTKPGVFDGPLGKTAGLDVLAYDQRGLGQTSKPESPYTMQQYADDAAGLLDHVGWSTCAVIGVSFGGMVAQELAIRHGARVDRLALVCTSSGGAGGASYPLHTLVDLPDDEKLAAQLSASDTRFDAAWQAANPKDAAKVFDTMRARATVTDDGARAQLDARSRHDAYDRLRTIACPTFVAAGRYDGIAPVANSEAIAAQIPNSTLEVFEGGHLFLLQDRAAWPRIVGFVSET